MTSGRAVLLWGGALSRERGGRARPEGLAVAWAATLLIKRRMTAPLATAKTMVSGGVASDPISDGTG
jgi:hypothetical protein